MTRGKTKERSQPPSKSSTTPQSNLDAVQSTVKLPVPIGRYTLPQVDRKLLKQALSEYRYISPSKTFCERLWLVQFWNATAEFYPPWLAPNTVTLFGYFCSVAVFILTLTYGPEFNSNQNFPSWYYLVVAFLMFLYQTADGSDGPQARRMKCGSALGELFDHGVDAVVTSSIYIVGSQLSGTGLHSPVAPFAMVATVSAFFFSNASLLHTSRQLFNDLDAQECQIVVQLSLVATYFLGPEIWSTALPVPDFFTSFLCQQVPTFASALEMNEQNSTIPLRMFMNVGVTLFAVYNTVDACRTVTKHYKTMTTTPPTKTSTSSSSSNIATTAGTAATGRSLSEFWQQVSSMLMLFVLIVVSWYVSATAAATGNNVYALRLWFMTCAFAFADHVNHILVLRVAKIPFPTWIRTRCFWLLTLFILWSHVGNQVDVEKVSWIHQSAVEHGETGRFVICCASMASHFYYSYTVGGAIAQSKIIILFSRLFPDNFLISSVLLFSFFFLTYIHFLLNIVLFLGYL